MSPKTFYTVEEADEVLFEDRGEFQAHFIPGILYVIASTIMIFIVIILK
jgi:hypothetical protein